jgi:hypothetical protein
MRAVGTVYKLFADSGDPLFLTYDAFGGRKIRDQRLLNVEDLTLPLDSPLSDGVVDG